MDQGTVENGNIDHSQMTHQGILNYSSQNIFVRIPKSDMQIHLGFFCSTVKGFIK